MAKRGIPGASGILGPIAAVLAVVFALLACVDDPAVHLSVAPANQLRLELDFAHLLDGANQVKLDVKITNDDGKPVELANSQHLTVNGNGPTSTDSGLLCCAYHFTLARLNAGDHYTLGYTDEQGQQTSVDIPAPQRALSITSPAAHAQVPIPQPGGAPPCTIRCRRCFSLGQCHPRPNRPARSSRRWPMATASRGTTALPPRPPTASPSWAPRQT